MNYYSASTNGFYNDLVHGTAIPADAKPETAWSDTYANIVTNRSAAKIIVADANGCPALADPASPSNDQLLEDARNQAIIALTKSDITILRCVENGISIPSAWISYRASLRTIAAATTGDPQKLPEPPTAADKKS